MIAPVHTAEYRAITLGSEPFGATIGGIARIVGAWNARAMPNMKAMPNNGVTDVGLLSAYSTNNPDVTTSALTVSSATPLRLKWSATDPLTSTSIAMGRNSANPIHPRSDLRPVMPYACFRRAVDCKAMPEYKMALLISRVRTGRTCQTCRLVSAGVT